MNKQIVIKVKTCIIHRVTLINENDCYKCQTKCKNIQKDQVQLCFICYQQLNYQESCPYCYQCTSCSKYTRQPGICLFCSHIWNKSLIIKFYNEYPSSLLSNFICPNVYQFNKDNQNKLVDRHILKIIFEYL